LQARRHGVGIRETSVGADRLADNRLPAKGRCSVVRAVGSVERRLRRVREI